MHQLTFNTEKLVYVKLLYYIDTIGNIRHREAPPVAFNFELYTVQFLDFCAY